MLSGLVLQRLQGGTVGLALPHWHPHMAYPHTHSKLLLRDGTSLAQSWDINISQAVAHTMESTLPLEAMDINTEPRCCRNTDTDVAFGGKSSTWTASFLSFQSLHNIFHISQIFIIYLFILVAHAFPAHRHAGGGHLCAFQAAPAHGRSSYFSQGYYTQISNN